MPKKEESKKIRIEDAINEVRLAMLENIYANDAVVKSEQRKKAAHFRLQNAKEELIALECELKNQ